jgi:hypothetical protein
MEIIFFFYYINIYYYLRKIQVLKEFCYNIYLYELKFRDLPKHKKESYKIFEMNYILEFEAVKTYL